MFVFKLTFNTGGEYSTSSGFRWKHLFRYSLENSFSSWMLYTLSAIEGTSLRQISVWKQTEVMLCDVIPK